MKKLLSVMLSVVALTVFAKVNGSLKFVPVKVDGIICVDSAKGMNNDVVSQMFNSNPDFQNGINKLNTELKPYGLQAKDMFQDITIFISKENQSGAIVCTKITDSVFKKMLNDGVFQKLNDSMNIKTSKIGSNTVYSFPSSCCDLDSAALPQNVNIDAPENLAFSYVDANHVLFADLNDMPKILAALKTGNLAGNNSFNSKLKEVNTDAMLWLLFDMPDSVSQDPAIAQQAGGVDLIGCSLNVSGKQNDININGFVRCKSDQMATQYAQQAQFMIMMLGGSAFQGDQQLAMDVTKAIKISNKANDIKVNVVIPEDLQTKLKAFAEKAAKEKAQMMQNGGNDSSIQPAPAGTKQ